MLLKALAKSISSACLVIDKMFKAYKAHLHLAPFAQTN